MPNKIIDWSDQGLTLHLPANGPVLLLQFTIAAMLLLLTLTIIKFARAKSLPKLSESTSLNWLAWITILLSPIYLTLFVFFIIGLFSLLKSLPSTILSAEADNPLRWHLLAIVGMTTALGGVIALPLALIRTFTTERQTRTAERQFDVTVQGHVTDRFTKAVELLGAYKVIKTDDVDTAVPNIEVRLGALYALERIAQDSLRDHIPIMETLCAYIRENTQHPRLNKDNALRHPRSDVQAAMDIIGRREHANVGRIAYEAQQKPPYRLDLRATQLAKVNLHEAIIGPADFHDANMYGANFTGTNLAGSSLCRANIDSAYMIGSILTSVDFYQCVTEKLLIADVDLRGAYNLGQSQIDSMFGIFTVKLSDTLKYPNHWPQKRMTEDEFQEEYAKWKANRTSH